MPDDEQMIDVFDPNGVRGQIPASQASDAFTKEQYKYASPDGKGNWKSEQPVAVTSPEGAKGFLPLSEAGEAMKNRKFQIGHVDTGALAELRQARSGGIAGAMVNRVADTVKGVGKFINPLPNEEEQQRQVNPQGMGDVLRGGLESMVPGGQYISRLVGGQASAEKEAFGQAKNQFKSGNNLQGIITAASMVDPFATGPVTNVNRLNEQGKGDQATGEGLTDAIMLGMGSKPGRAVVGKAANAVERLGGPMGEEAITAAVRPKPTQIAPFRAAINAVKEQLGPDVNSLEALRDTAKQNRLAAASQMDRAIQDASENKGMVPASSTGPGTLNARAISDAITNTPISRVTEASGSAVRQKMVNFAQEFTKDPLNVAVAEKEIQTISAMQRGIKRMSPSEQSAYFKEHPEHMALDNLKNELNRQIDNMAGGQDLKNARSAYQKWRTIEDTVQGTIDDRVAKGGNVERTGAVNNVVRKGAGALPLVGAGLGAKIGGIEGAALGGAAGRAAEGAIVSKFAGPDYLVERGVKTMKRAAPSSGTPVQGTSPPPPPTEINAMQKQFAQRSTQVTTLGEAGPAINQLTGDAVPNLTEHPIMQNGKRVGRVTIKPDTGEIGYIGPDIPKGTENPSQWVADHPLEIGQSGVKNLIRQLKAEHPGLQAEDLFGKKTSNRTKPGSIQRINIKGL